MKLSKILILLLLLGLSSCKWFSSISSPFLSLTNIKVPDGTPTFQAGFKDGCSTVVYSRGNEVYRRRYKYRYDPKMIGNPEYRFGHARGYSWCFQYMFSAATNVGSFDRFLNPGGYDKTFDAGNINNAWDGFFGGGNSIWGSSVTTPGAGLDSMMSVFQTGLDGKQTTFGANPLWAGGSKGQFFGQQYYGYEDK